MPGAAGWAVGHRAIRAVEAIGAEACAVDTHAVGSTARGGARPRAAVLTAPPIVALADTSGATIPKAAAVTAALIPAGELRAARPAEA